MEKYKQQAKELKRLSDKIDDKNIALKIYMAAMSILELDALYETTQKELVDRIEQDGGVN